MTRVHDMGGRFGDGAVVPEDETGPVFHEDWHARALAMTVAAGFLGQWNLDMSRHAREGLAPTDYARFSYYEKWMAGLADLLVATGVLTEDDLAGRGASARHPLAERALTRDTVAAAVRAAAARSRELG